ncbi:MAG: hypothetical protein AABZ15_07180 [Nitrospirota bacterium]
MNMRGYLRAALIVVLGVVPLLLSCGGGGGGSTSPAPAGPSISGTAAIGSAAGHKKIEIIDDDGNPASGVTDGEGKFMIPTTGLTPPYLLRVITSAPTTTLYSVSADLNATTTINITPLTDLIIRSWYKVKTVDIDAAFANPVPAANKPPSPDAVSLIHNLIKNMIQLWLDKNGVTSSDFNLISTPFTAASVSVPATGIDKVLEQAWINAGPGSIVLSDGTTTQNSTLSTYLSNLTASTTTVSVVTGSNVDSGNNDMTVVPTSPEEKSALESINALLSDLSNTINARGAALVESDLLTILDPGLLESGLNQAQVAARLVADHKGTTASLAVMTILQFDTTNVQARIRGGRNGPWYFKKIGSRWLISGNDRIALVTLTTQYSNNQQDPSKSGLKVSTRIEALPGVVSGVTITGGGIWNIPTTVPYSGLVSYPSHTIDMFQTGSGILPQAPPKDTPFTVTISTVASGTIRYELLSNAYTTEPIIFTNITGTTLAAANLDIPTTVTWTEPLTFPILSRTIRINIQTAVPQDICIISISATTSSSTITIPSTCNGNPTTLVGLGMYIRGVNMESTAAIWRFQ